MLNLNAILGEKKKKKETVKKEIIIDFDAELIFKEKGIQIFEKKIYFEERYEDRLLKEFPFESYFFESNTEVKLENTLYYDTETTGLSGGAGTYVFLFGCGYITDKSFIVRQYFMEELNAEKFFLEKIKELCDQFSFFISFNGKSYDSTMINNRAQFHNTDLNLKTKPQLDLLHLSRRLWKRKLQSCSLESLEYFILHFERDWQSDISGRDIPEAYFQFLESSDTTDIANILYHNIHDVISMHIIFYIITSVFAEKIPFSAVDIDIRGLAKSLVKFHKIVAAKLLLENQNPDCFADSCDFLFEIYLKTNEKDRAKSLALNYYKRFPQMTLFLCKHYEHKEKEYDKALDFTNIYEQQLSKENFLSSNLLADLRKRKKRLQLKISQLI